MACNACGGTQGAFEITAFNADKGSLPAAELARRATQFDALSEAVLLSNAALFVDKAALMPDCTFVVGYDTAVRIINPKYYGDSAEKLAAVLAAIRGHRCSFLVAGRLMDGRFFGGNELSPPSGFEGAPPACR